MAGASESSDDGMITGINVTPLVDIVLVLLIIFMLTANIIANPSILVDLPSASSGEEIEPTLLGITITKEGGIFLNEEEIDIKALQGRITELTTADAPPQALIAADHQVDYGNVVRVIDAVKRAGVTRFALNIQLKEIY